MRTVYKMKRSGFLINNNDFVPEMNPTVMLLILTYALVDLKRFL